MARVIPHGLEHTFLWGQEIGSLLVNKTKRNRLIYQKTTLYLRTNSGTSIIPLFLFPRLSSFVFTAIFCILQLVFESNGPSVSVAIQWADHIAKTHANVHAYEN